MCFLVTDSEDPKEEPAGNSPGPRDVVLVGGASLAAFVATELARVVGLLEKLGVRGVGTQIAIASSASAIALLQRVLSRRRRIGQLVRTAPRRLWRIPARDLGLTPSVLAEPFSPNGIAPYVARDFDEKLVARMGNERFVLVVGGSDAGKDRSAANAAATAHANMRALVPAEPSGNGRDPLAEIMALDAASCRGRSYVLLIQDLERHLDKGEIDVQQVRRWLARNPKRRIVATIGSEQHDRYVAGGPGTRAGADVLRLASKYELPGRWSSAEMARAAIRLPGIDRALPSLSRYLGRGDRILRRWHTAEEVCPVGAAVARAAAEIRRAGWRRPIPATALRSLFERYLGSMPFDGDVDALFATGLAWATDVSGRAPLLERVVRDEVLLTVSPLIVEDVERRYGATHPQVLSVVSALAKGPGGEGQRHRQVPQPGADHRRSSTARAEGL